MSNPQGFSERLRSRRAELGLTQRELSKKSGIAVPQLSRYELGQSMPRADIAAKIANALDVTYDWLVGGTGTIEGAYPRNDLPSILPYPPHIMMGELNVPISFHIPQKLLKLLQESSLSNKNELHTEIIRRLEQSYKEKQISTDEVLEAIGKKIQQAIAPISNITGRLIEMNRFMDNNKELFDEEVKKAPEASLEEIFDRVQKRIEESKSSKKTK